MVKQFSLLLILVMIFSTFGFSQSNKDFYFVFLGSNPNKETLSKEKVEELQKGHTDNIEKLYKEGSLFAAGSLEGGGGILILFSESIDEAKALLRTDPAVAANRFIVEIFPFNVTNGRITGAEEPYEMVAYQMVRLFPNTAVEYDIDKINFTNRLFMSELHNDQNKLLIHGWLGYQMEEGSVLIMKAENKEDAIAVINEHPAVISGDLEYTVTPLQIAKGTFSK